MRRLRPLLLAMALFLCGAAAQAQSGGRTKVLLYKDRIAAQWDTVKAVRNVLKVNPLLFLRGEIPLYYERALSSRLSAELAVGITYRNYLNLSFAGDDADDFGAGTHILAKPSFHIGARYYLRGDLEPQGAYLQVEMAYLDYAKNIAQKDSTGQFNGKELLDERIYNDVRAYFGYQWFAATSNWMFDLYCGAGYRHRDRTIVHEQLNIAENRWDYTIEKKRDNVPAFFVGVKVGYGF